MAILNFPRSNVTNAPSVFLQQEQREQQQKMARLQLEQLSKQVQQIGQPAPISDIARQNIQSQIDLRTAQTRGVGKGISKTDLIGQLGKMQLEGRNTPQSDALLEQLLKPSTQQSFFLGAGPEKSAKEDAKIAIAFQNAADEINAKNPDAETEAIVKTSTRTGARFIATEPKSAAGAGQIKEFTDLISLRDSAVTIQGLFDKSFVGLLEGSNILGAIERGTGLLTSPNEIIFKRLVRDLSDRLLRARSGAQINETEFRRLTKIVPQLNTEDKVFVAELENFITELNNVITVKQRVSKAAGQRGLVDVEQLPKKEGAFKLGEIRISGEGKEFKFIGNGQWQEVVK